MMRLIQKRFLFIKNTNFKSCVNCINFIEEKHNYPYEELPNDKLYGQCKKFGTQDLVTGQIENDFAVLSRSNDKKCGIIGKYFEQKLV
jgi:hypothetical protein